MRDTLPYDLRLLIEDTFTAYELVDLLDIPIQDIVAVFEDEILRNLPLVKNELRHYDNDK